MDTFAAVSTRKRVGGAATLVEGNGHPFEVTNDGAVFKIGDTEYRNANNRRYLHMSASYDVVGWIATSASDNGASYWYIVPVDEVSVPLNTAADGKSYATLCLPFNAELSTTGVTAYAGKSKGEGFVNVEAVDGSIAADQGVLLVGEAGEASATFNVATPADVTYDFSGNIFQGTNTQLAGTGDMYVFNQVDNQVGFYLLNGTLAANRAYIEKPAAGGEAMRLVFGGNVTGIESIDNGQWTIDNDAPIYDLSGRRVLAPAKGGIYVKGGKKMIVK